MLMEKLFESCGVIAILCGVVALFTHKAVFGWAMLGFAFVFAVYATIKIKRDGDG